MLSWTRFSYPLRRAVTAATAGAGTDEAGPEHLLVAVCRDRTGGGRRVLQLAGVDVDALLDAVVRPDRPMPHRRRAVRFSATALHLLDVAAHQAERMNHHRVLTSHVALAAGLAATPLAETLRARGFDAESARSAVVSVAAEKPKPPSRWFDRLPARFRRGLELASLGWKVAAGKSLLHPKFVTNPYPMYAWLRDRPVRKDPVAPVFVATRYADVSLVLKDGRFDKDPFATNRLPASVRDQLGIDDPDNFTSNAGTLSMLFLDPPAHTRVRAMFSRAFTPKMIQGLAPRIQRIADERLRAVAGRGQFDLIETLAYPLPVIVIAELLGFPTADYPRFKKWSDDFAASLGINPTAEQQSAAADSRAELEAYFEALVPTLIAHPADNLLSALLAIENESGALDRAEIFTNATLLLAAGHETTTNLIANGIWHLLQHPDQLQLLRDKPELIDSAVEELLRFDSPVQWVSRVAATRLDLGGTVLEAGDIVLASLGAANRDPRQFPNPDQLDLARADNRHLSFGSGIHFCLGATLARMEAGIAIATVLRNYPLLKPVTTKPRWKKGLIFRAMRRLDVRA